MDLARYDANDAYILEELRREYQASDAKGRIRLLKRLHRAAPNMGVPLVVALMALEDPHVEVRQWIARHGEFLTSGADPTLSLLATVLEPLGGFQPGEGTLADKLKNDPDPFVRACLRENPEVFNFILADSWKQAFAEATHLERLALMRNPKVHADLIERVFDCEDNELGVAPNERSELVMAYLTNAEALKPSRGLGTGARRLRPSGNRGIGTLSRGTFRDCGHSSQSGLGTPGTSSRGCIELWAHPTRPGLKYIGLVMCLGGDWPSLRAAMRTIRKPSPSEALTSMLAVVSSRIRKSPVLGTRPCCLSFRAMTGVPSVGWL